MYGKKLIELNISSRVRKYPSRTTSPYIQSISDPAICSKTLSTALANDTNQLYPLASAVAWPRNLYLAGFEGAAAQSILKYLRKIWRLHGWDDAAPR
jgi:hypothetical protein